MNKFIYIFSASLPFTYAMTVDLYFPLKISEVLAVLACCYFFIRFSLNLLKLEVSRPASYFIKLSAVIVFAYVIVFLIGLCNVGMNIEVLPSWATGRHDPFYSGIYAICYLCINLFVFLLFFENKNSGYYASINGWLLGATLASSYFIVSYLFQYFGLGHLMLPGMDETKHGAYLFGVRYLRGGTFSEGNYFSLYLILSIALSFYSYHSSYKKKYIYLAFLFIISLFLTQSTIGLFCFFVGAICYFIWRVVAGVNRTIFSIFVFPVILALGVVAVLSSDFADKVLWQKVWSDTAQYSISRSERLLQSTFAIDLFISSPLAGSGLNNYGIFFDDFHEVNGKVIPNNIYLSVLSSGGVLLFMPLMFLFFAIFVFFIKRASSHSPVGLIFVGFLLMLLHFNFYPTFNFFFIWVFLSIMLSSVSRCDSNSMRFCS